MANDLIVAPAAGGVLTAPSPQDDSLGIDRAFVVQMARMPVLALGWVAAAVVANSIWAAVSPDGLNMGALLVVSFGMVLAAFVDGWALKGPNWITLPLVLSGWMLGLLHSFGLSPDGGTGGIIPAIGGTFLGFLLLFPMLVIRGVGEGDVKMQMGFGAWVGAYFGTGLTTDAAGLGQLHWAGVLFWAFCFGAITGGVFGAAMILIRRRFSQNASTVGEILMDLQLFASGNPTQAAKRAEKRRDRWVKLPYGIPLCVGFLLYLWYMLILPA